MQDIYHSHGYNSRMEYLECLADDYNVPFDTVLALAEMLGPNEDFDGLVVSLEDGDCCF